VTAPGAAQKLILDCDPGIDDALAILFACGHPGLELCGVTTVAGNVSLALTTANALAVLEFAGHGEVPVTPGSQAPLLRAPARGDGVHGETGLGAARLPAPRGQARAGHAADFLIERISAAPGEIVLVATGPLTNIALAVRREPRIVTQVRDFVIMGGSAGRGNVTPAAEFNIWCDPEAAAIVFAAGWRVTMAGLDVTLQTRATPPVLDRMRELGALGSELLLPSLAGYQHQDDEPGDGPPVHDVCALALVTAPGVFGCRPARVDVETTGRLTAGMTVTDFRTADPNALVALTVDVGGFWDLVLGAYARLPAARA
jgi:inosine-uridine nucleoside N-ribohydrolase